jgi:hypothetical protein
MGKITIKSNVDPNNDKLFERILLNTKSHEQTEKIFIKMEYYLDSIMVPNGIKVKTFKENELSLDNADIKQVIEEYKPDGILFIHFQSGKTINGTLSNMVLLGQFVNIEKKK